MNSRTAYLRAPAIADRLGVSVRTVRRWIAAEILPSTLIGRSRLVAEEDLQRALGRPDVDLAIDDDDHEI